ncbi:MAG: type IV secretory system conjugative DNA transfer family protein, partial [Alphaproteobacteria bacterium]|nr:type IV secretory system conjugative DNA transfer family protein [Alphaproteobacteria bacterium]
MKRGLIWGLFALAIPFVAWAFAYSWLLDGLPPSWHPAMEKASPLVLMAVGGVFLMVNSGSRWPFLVGVAVALWWSGKDLFLIGQWAIQAAKEGRPAYDIIVGLSDARVLAVAITFAVGMLSLLAVFPGALAILNLGGGLNTKRAKSGFHGAAEWLDAQKIALLGKSGGMILGQDKPGGGKLIRYNLEAHALVIAPTRSGKGASQIVTNLLAPGGDGCAGPVVVIDPKAEAFSITGRRRRALPPGRQVALLDPFGVVARLAAQHPELEMQGVETLHYNPLDFVRGDTGMVQDISVLLHALVPPPGENASDGGKHFGEGARTLISGVVAWVCATEPGPTRNFGRVRDLLLAPRDAQDALFAAMQAAPDVGFGLPKAAADLMLGVDMKERGSFFSTAQNGLKWLQYPELREHVSRSDFDVMALADNTLDLFIVC